MPAVLNGPGGLGARRTLPTLALANFAVGTGALVTAGVLNQIAEGLAVSVADAGQLIAVYALDYAVGAPLLSAVAGTVDRKWVLVIGLMLFAVGAALAALSPGYLILIAARVRMACGAALITPTSLALAGFLAEPAQRGKAMSLVFGGFALPTSSACRWAPGSAGIVAGACRFGSWLRWAGWAQRVRWRRSSCLPGHSRWSVRW